MVKQSRKLHSHCHPLQEKKQYIVKRLAKEVGLTVASPKKKTKNGLNNDVIDKGKDFYSNDKISWQAPGHKDFVTIRTVNSDVTNTKTTEQTCYLTVSLKEAYHHFMTMNLNKKVGLSKFCDLRPPNIKLFDSIPHNICICIYHENMHLLLAIKIYKAFRIISKFCGLCYLRSFFEVIHQVRMQNFPKNYYFYAPNTHTYVCISGG